MAKPETIFQNQVIHVAQLHGWTVMHVYPQTSRRRNGSTYTRTATTVPGWPDLLCYKPGRFIARELKTDIGRVTPKQKQVLADLDASGIDVGVWRPKDWDLIVSTLKQSKH